MSSKTNCDVIVIGGGSAALEAAIAARQSGAERVVMLEKAPSTSPAATRSSPMSDSFRAFGRRSCARSYRRCRKSGIGV